MASRVLQGVYVPRPASIESQLHGQLNHAIVQCVPGLSGHGSVEATSEVVRVEQEPDPSWPLVQAASQVFLLHSIVFPQVMFLLHISSPALHFSPLALQPVCAFQLVMNPFPCLLSLSRLSTICSSWVQFLFDCSMIVQLSRLFVDCDWAAEVERPVNRNQRVLYWLSSSYKVQYILRIMCLWDHKVKK